MVSYLPGSIYPVAGSVVRYGRIDRSKPIESENTILDQQNQKGEGVMAVVTIGWQGILLRFLFAAILVFCTYNPDGYSYFDWALMQLPEITPLKVFAGIVLLIGWVIYIRATIRSLGIVGLVLALGFFATLLWMIVDWGLVPADSVRAITYLTEVVMSGILAVGMSWSHIRRRLSGQADVDEIEE